ncbi:peptidoglycan-binding protein [Streptomyces sp. NPDC051940]|uniref:peptidoglycan-binding domain-containing protein n=1 Tax=Streptomyces sp. NPDC051940 TaxID=3155675 RepID=UPI003440D340
MRLKTKAAVFASAAALLLGTGLATAPTAAASTSQGYVYGGGWGQYLWDDWNDEGVVDQNSHRISNATGLWQLVLWADGAIEQNGTRFDLSDVDCDFGPNTAYATASWQRAIGQGALDDDGSAGPLTWGYHGGYLNDDGNNRDITYAGYPNLLHLRRVNGIYQFQLNGVWHKASYTSATC